MTYVVKVTSPNGNIIMWFAPGRVLCERDMAEIYASTEEPRPRLI
jgi:hypothetical protein